MIIERVQVDDGFLDGLDITFAAGLNVIIGGRGTGKTSIIELIRYCLGVPAQTSEAGRRSLEHALSVLEDGRITVTLRENDETTVVSRSAAEAEPEATDEFDLPALFSQKEIESLGLSPSARIALLDSFIVGLNSVLEPKELLVKKISSLTTEAASISKEIEAFDQQLLLLPPLESELAELIKEEQSVAIRSKEIAEKQRSLKLIAEHSSQLAVQANVYQRASKALSTWLFDLDGLIESAPDIESWPETAGGDDKLVGSRQALLGALKDLDGIKKRLSINLIEVQANARIAQKTKTEVDEKIRVIRKEVEALEKGAGEIVKRGNALREKIAGLKATEKLRAARVAKRQLVSIARGKLLDEFEGLHRQRFLNRGKVAAGLNKALGPQIHIDVRQASEYTEYVNAITFALRGSGLRYNELAPMLASAVSPRELVEAIETQNVDFISTTASIPRDRAIRLLGSLKETRLENLLTVAVDDDAIFQLLDGKDYKDVQQLSVGQRCTVVLPIVLEHTDRVLIVDQPEDHLDNAFIVDTFIRALRQKKKPPQMIFSTHNANIPVLGEAKNILVMRSNGIHGFVHARGPLESSEIVHEITSIMEGGRAAFEARAKFYRENDVA